MECDYCNVDYPREWFAPVVFKSIDDDLIDLGNPFEMCIVAPEVEIRVSEIKYKDMRFCPQCGAPTKFRWPLDV